MLIIILPYPPETRVVFEAAYNVQYEPALVSTRYILCVKKHDTLYVVLETSVVTSLMTNDDRFSAFFHLRVSESMSE